MISISYLRYYSTTALAKSSLYICLVQPLTPIKELKSSQILLTLIRIFFVLNLNKTQSTVVFRFPAKEATCVDEFFHPDASVLNHQSLVDLFDYWFGSIFISDYEFKKFTFPIQKQVMMLSYIAGSPLFAKFIRG